MLKKFIRWYKLKTHRAIATNVLTKENLDMRYKFAPQWWFLWWHYYYIPAGYQFEVPRSYDTYEESKEFLEYTCKFKKLRIEEQKSVIYPME